MIQVNYGITVNPITERVHQALGTIICTCKVQYMVLDNQNPWDGILASTMFVLHVTYQHDGAQPSTISVYEGLFGQDSILNIHHKAN